MTDLSAFDEGDAKPTGNIGPLLILAAEALALKEELDDLDALVKVKKGRENEIKTKLLPDAMAEAGMSEFKTPEGAKISVEDFVAGSLPKEPAERAEAIKEIEAGGGEAMLKSTLTLWFEKSAHNEMLALADDLRGRGLAPVVESSVHPQTLLAWVRERLRGGEPVDLQKLGLFSGRKAKYTLPRKKKASGE